MKMLLNQKSKRAFKGYIEYSLMQHKNVFLIASIILAFLTLSNVILTFIQYGSYPQASPGEVVSGMSYGLTIGLSIAAAVFAVAAFLSATDRKITAKLKFPLSRQVFAAGNLASLLASAGILLMMVMAASILETIFGNVFASIHKDAVLINNITLENYLTGLWVSASYMVLVASVAYCLGMYFFRYIKTVSVILVLAICFVTLYSPAGKAVLNGFYWLAGEPSMVLFSIKAWVLIGALHLISYLPLKRMEVFA